jgi:hypothetical protein
MFACGSELCPLLRRYCGAGVAQVCVFRQPIRDLLFCGSRREAHFDGGAASYWIAGYLFS